MSTNILGDYDLETKLKTYKNEDDLIESHLNPYVKKSE